MRHPNSPSVPNPPAASRNSSALLRILVVAAVLLAAGFATLPFERGATSPIVGEPLVAPAGSMVAAPVAQTSVPAAAEVFTGREAAAEPAPTF